jgi:hypothetical protein
MEGLDVMGFLRDGAAWMGSSGIDFGDFLLPCRTFGGFAAFGKSWNRPNPGATVR